MEQWSDGVMGLKEFLATTDYFFNFSNSIPLFQSSVIPGAARFNFSSL
jgi:hypothetical protein